MNNWDLIKLKSFCKAKETIKKYRMEKIFANDMTDRELICKIYKYLIQLHVKKTNNAIKKWSEDLKRPFIKEDRQIAKKHMKRCSMSQIIREMHIKTIMRDHLISVRVGNIKKSMNNKCWKGFGEKGTLLHFS